jgi:hypothetical protein
VFEEAWLRALGRHSDEENAEDWFCGMAGLDFGVAAALEALDGSRAGNSALQLAAIIQGSVFELKGSKSGFWGNVSDDRDPDMAARSGCRKTLPRTRQRFRGRPLARRTGASGSGAAAGLKWARWGVGRYPL